MYIKKINFVIYLILAVVAGFGLGLLTRGFIAESGFSSGDISKAAGSGSADVSPAMSAFRDKVANDSTEFRKAVESLTMLTSLMDEFDELVSIASAASEGNEALASSIGQLLKIKQIASNARDNGVMALESLNAMAEGRKSSVNYELASQNLSLAFLMVDRQVSVGKQYVCDVDEYLSGKDVSKYKDLASVRDLWAGYCAREAAINKDGKEMDYWSRKGNLLPASANTSDRSLQYLCMASELSSSVDVNQIMQNVLPGVGLMASATDGAMTPDAN